MIIVLSVSKSVWNKKKSCNLALCRRVCFKILPMPSFLLRFLKLLTVEELRERMSPVCYHGNHFHLNQ